MDDARKKVRKENVLDIIVKYHIDTAEPVGSGAVSDEMELSSATVRNIMSELEEMGLITHPYTSAGRIPTEKGYRFYVDFLMKPEDVPSRERENIETIFQLESKELEDVVEAGSRILSSLSSLAAIFMFPRTNSEKIYCDGAHHMLEQPEFRDTEKMRLLFKELDEKKVILDLLKEDLSSEGIRVRIGSENKSSALTQCSLITANYSVDEAIFGTFGILGPIRMEYERLVPRVEYFADTIRRFLGKG